MFRGAGVPARRISSSEIGLRLRFGVVVKAAATDSSTLSDSWLQYMLARDDDVDRAEAGFRLAIATELDGQVNLRLLHGLYFCILNRQCLSESIQLLMSLFANCLYFLHDNTVYFGVGALKNF